MDVKLVMFKADGTRSEFPLSKPRTILGRTNTCDLRIPLSSVSRHHCEISIDGEHIRARDMGSSNGTYHNSTRIQEAELSAGDEIVVGPVVFTVVVDGQPSDVNPVRSAVEDDQTRAAAGEVHAAEQPRELPVNQPAQDMPSVEEESYTPTVDLDDPVAELQKLADGRTKSQKGRGPDSSGDIGGGAIQEDDDLPVPLEDEDEEEDEELPLLDDEDQDDQDDEDIPFLAEADPQDEDDDLPLLADDEDDERKHRSS